MTSQEVLIERERIRRVIQRKFFYIIKIRKKLKYRKRRLIPLFEKLMGDILFLVDNPNYVRKT